MLETKVYVTEQCRYKATWLQSTVVTGQLGYIEMQLQGNLVTEHCGYRATWLHSNAVTVQLGYRALWLQGYVGTQE